MATKKSQRIFIWVIAIVMTVGTVAGFIAMMIAPTNQKIDQERVAKLTSQYQTDYAAYQAEVDAQTAELSAKYYGTFKQYSTRPAAFDASGVSELKKEDLLVGDGEEETATTSYSAYYIGWNPTGKIFDQSIDGDKLKSPIAGGNLIEGWDQGVIGMKVGGVRELTIPASQAYGETGSGEDIPANTPLKFIVFVIPTVKTIPEPAMPAELQKYYGG
ncbi:MAG: putative Peptidylprolyl isomerase [Candidatus Saccharibacteria bacterium]|nr:putative Peptidylprolyl isomerase [Candidatus Saccharibacteria bacterium]